MSSRVVWVVSALVVLTLLNFFWPVPPSPLTSSSFGKAGSGHGALYDLLAEAGASRGRSFESGRRLADEGTIWWIDPVGVCDGRIAMGGEADVLDAEDVQWPVGSWVREGGTAAVFLQSADPGGPVLAPQGALVTCDAIAGVPVPLRDRLEAAAPDQSEPGTAHFRIRGDAHFRIRGDLTQGARALSQAKAYAFQEALDWDVLASVERVGDADVLPFVLSRSLGAGRLVVVADSGFTHNAWLDRADAAPLAVDLVAALGPPRFDEREHGFVPETSALRYIGRSAARPVFLGLLALGLLYAWRGNALPSRSVAEVDTAAPTLDNYVTSMAALYARTRDHARVVERYRELTVSRLERHFGLPPGLGPQALLERIEGDPRRLGAERRTPGETIRERMAILVEPPAVSSASDLESAARELDSIVMEVAR